MPSTSKAQHNAMEAAAHGHSTLGIPKKVGQEFAAADKGKKFKTAAVSKALRKRPPAPVPEPPEPDDATLKRAGYSKAHGMGTG